MAEAEGQRARGGDACLRRIRRTEAWDPRFLALMLGVVGPIEASGSRVPPTTCSTKCAPEALRFRRFQHLMIRILEIFPIVNFAYKTGGWKNARGIFLLLYMVISCFVLDHHL